MKKLVFLILLITNINLYAQVKSDKNNIDKYFNTEISQKQRQSYYKSIHDYSVALRENPSAEVYVNRGVSYARLGLYPDAISDYNRALKIDSLYPYAFYNRGVARARFRYTKRACMDIKKSAELGLFRATKTYNNNCGLFISDLGKIK